MSIEVGEKVNGKVSGITNFGAFVDLGDKKTGLVHISEVSNNYVKDIHDVLTVGDEVKVKVLSVENDGKISLSIRKATDMKRFDQNKKTSDEKKHFEGDRRERGSKNSSASKNRNFTAHRTENKKKDFDSLLAGFLKESDERLTSLKRNTEGKRGGRGGRRS
ncbi:S1 domain-containing RNA-binding protein [Ligilactobacillus faecis]|uniref:S1 domain-containing RNA-binding protein n=1 Tax=Ligilactobacillus faecis TaxID=762833 RepID=A0ABV4DU43_9LACO